MTLKTRSMTALSLSLLLAGASLPALAQSTGEATPGTPAAHASARHDAIVPLQQLLADAQRRYPGTVTGVDLDDGRYEIEIRQRNGREVELDYSARTGELLHVDLD